MSATAGATRPLIGLIAGLAVAWQGVAHAATVTGKVVAVDAAHSDADLGTLDERISPVVTTISTGWRFERVKAA